MIDPTKTTPEKLAEMNDSLIVDNNYLRGRVHALEEALAVECSGYADDCVAFTDGGCTCGKCR